MKKNGISLFLPYPEIDYRDSADSLFQMFSDQVFAKIKTYNTEANYQILKSVVEAIDKDKIDKMLMNLKKKKAFAYMDIDKNIDSIVDEILKDSGISKKERDIFQVEFAEQLKSEISTTLFSIESKTARLLNKSLVENMKYDSNLLSTMLQQGETLEESGKLYRDVFKQDYKQELFHQLMKDEEFKRRFEDGTFNEKFQINGRTYDNIDNYLDQRGEWAVSDVIRATQEMRIRSGKYNIVEFLIVNPRPVKVPRKEHIDLSRKRFFWIEKEVDEYKGMPCYPITDIKEFDLSSMVFYAPYGCRHGVVPVE